MYEKHRCRIYGGRVYGEWIPIRRYFRIFSVTSSVFFFFWSKKYFNLYKHTRFHVVNDPQTVFRRIKTVILSNFYARNQGKLKKLSEIKRRIFVSRKLRKCERPKQITYNKVTYSCRIIYYVIIILLL